MAPQHGHHSLQIFGVRVAGQGRTFYLFPKLPAEIQLKIWKSALPGPLVIEIMAPKRNIKLNEKQIKAREKAGLGTFQAYMRIFKTRLDQSELLPLLYACRDSRTTVLKFYRMSFKLNDFLRPLWFDHTQDVIVISHANTFHWFANVIKYLPQESVRFLALDAANIPAPFGGPRVMTEYHEDQVARINTASKIVESFATLETLFICHIQTPFRFMANNASNFDNLIQESMSKMEERLETNKKNKEAKDGIVAVVQCRIPKVVPLGYMVRMDTGVLNWMQSRNK